MTDPGSQQSPGEGVPASRSAPPRGTRAMALVRWALVALMAVAAFASLAHHFGWLQGSSGGGEAAAASETAKAAPAQYVCPMHPSVVRDAPGQCPICSMTLVPRESIATSEPAAVAAPAGGAPASPAGMVPIELTPQRIQLLGMRTAVVKRTRLSPQLRATGYVAARESALAQIHARFAGWIESLPVSETGQRVARGQVLATVYSQELLAAQQDLLNALKWSAGAATTPPAASKLAPVGVDLAAEARRRLQLLGISDAEIDEVVHSGRPKNALAIRSPIAGYVTRKTAVLGLYVEPGTELFQVADLSAVWVFVDVHEQQIAQARKGARARFTLAALPGKRFEGRVQFLYPALDAETRTLRVRLQLPNPGLLLRPGMYGDAVIEAPPSEGLVVPSEAIVDTGTTQYLFVALAGGRFEPRKVRLGTHAGAQVQVLQGVREGETVVTTANFLLDSESRIEASINGPAEAETETADDDEGQPSQAAAFEPEPEQPAQPAAARRQRPAAREPTPASTAPPAQDSLPPPAPPPAPRPVAAKSGCDRDFDAAKYPDKYRQCRACEIQHRGMGSMVDDCKAAIPGPWR